MGKINSDISLMQGIHNGDYVCYNHLFMRYYSRLCLYVFGIIKNRPASEDIVQELFIKIWDGRATIKMHENILSYLFKACKNSALNYLRDDANRKKSLEKLMLEETPIDHDFLEEEEFITHLENCIEQLPERSKQVFKLSRFEGRRQKEIAETLGISVKTIKNQIWRSMLFLKSCLENNGAF